MWHSIDLIVHSNAHGIDPKWKHSCCVGSKWVNWDSFSHHLDLYLIWIEKSVLAAATTKKYHIEHISTHRGKQEENV